MKFCRRCGGKLSQQGDRSHVFICDQGHIIFANADPAVGIALYNDKGEVIILERAIDPGKGLFDLPGGFCDGAEGFEFAARREIREEIGINPDQYDSLEYVLNAIDPYDYKGEVLQVVSVIFKARLKSDVIPVPADDAATATYMSLRELDMDKVYFPSIRKALEKMRDDLDNPA